MRRLLPCLGLIGAAALMLPGCHASPKPVAVPTAVPSKKPAAVPNAVANPTAAPLKPLEPRLYNSSATAYLKPVASGWGVVAGDPVPAAPLMQSPQGKALANFGAGCTRWLQLQFLNQGQLGKTPPWNQFNQMGNLAGWDSTIVDQPRALQLHQLLGVTHVVVSRISGNASSAVLALQLVKVPSGDPVGAEIKVGGAIAQIWAAMPAAAVELCHRLGVETQPAANGGASTDVVTLCGSIPLDPTVPLSGGNYLFHSQLHALGATFPLATLLTWRDSDGPHPVFRGGTGQGWPENYSAKISPTENSLGALTFLADVDHWQMDKHRQQWDQLQQRYPRNYALALGKFHLPNIHQWPVKRAAGKFHLTNIHQWPMKRAAGELAVRCSPDNPLAWHEFADGLTYEAYGPFAPDSKALFRLAEAASFEAVKRLPQNALLLRFLIEGAYYNGNHPGAVAALWRAQQLAPEDAHVAGWCFGALARGFSPDKDAMRRLRHLVTLTDARARANMGPIYAHESQYAVDTREYYEWKYDLLHQFLTNKGAWLDTDAHPAAELNGAWDAAWNHWGDHAKWLDLVSAAERQADRIRMGRPRRELCERESQVLAVIDYSRWLAADHLVRDRPNEPLPHLQLARALATYTCDGVQYEKIPATIELRKLLAKFPDYAPGYAWGLQYFQQEWEWNDQSLQDLAAVVVAKPKLLDALAIDVVRALGTVRSLNPAGQKTLAIARARLAKVGHEDTAWQSQLALYLQEAKKRGQEGAVLRNCIALHPDDAMAHLNYGLYLERNGRGPESLPEFQTAAKLDPHLALPHLKQVQWLESKADYATAETECRAALAQNPVLPEAWDSLGDVLRMQKRDPEAVDAWKHGLALDPTEKTATRPISSLRFKLALEEAKATGANLSGKSPVKF